MLSSALTRLKNGVEGARAFLDANHVAREMASRFQVGLEPSHLEYDFDRLRQIAPSPTAWRIFDHCAAMSRLYALFEQFCESVLADWIEFRTKGVKFVNLPEEIQNAYALGFPIALQDSKKVRYSHLIAADMISEYSNALKGEKEFRLTPECLTSHKGNIRWDEISGMFGRCGVEGLTSWVGLNTNLIDHFQEKKKILEQANSKLSEFVRYRNDAAHGLVAPDEILGRDQICDYAEFIVALCTCLSELVSHSAVEFLISSGIASDIGIVKEVKKNCVVVCNVEGANINLGDRLHLLTHRSCSVRVVNGLMLDDSPKNNIVVAVATEVGIQFDMPGIRRARVVAVSADYEQNG